MNNLSQLFAGIGFLFVLGSWMWYLSTIPRMAVPRRPIGTILFQALGAVAAIIALLAYRPESGMTAVLVYLLAGMALGFSLFFFWLLTQRKTPIGELQLSVGDQFLPFEAVTSDGTPFSSEEMAGQRVLFKFFRGGW